ncbi:hypothetical protein AKJ16_DCAP23876 [Drosera capensis]
MTSFASASPTLCRCGSIVAKRSKKSQDRQKQKLRSTPYSSARGSFIFSGGWCLTKPELERSTLFVPEDGLVFDTVAYTIEKEREKDNRLKSSPMSQCPIHARMVIDAKHGSDEINRRREPAELLLQ